MKVLIVQFFHLFVTSFLLGQNILLCIPFSNTLNVRPPTARNKVSHPYKRTGKFIVLYVQTFTILGI